MCCPPSYMRTNAIARCPKNSATTSITIICMWYMYRSSIKRSAGRNAAKTKACAALHLPEHLKKAHGIRPSGHGREDASALFEHVMAGHEIVNPFDHSFPHVEALSAETLKANPPMRSLFHGFCASVSSPALAFLPWACLPGTCLLPWTCLPGTCFSAPRDLKCFCLVGLIFRTFLLSPPRDLKSFFFVGLIVRAFLFSAPRNLKSFFFVGLIFRAFLFSAPRNLKSFFFVGLIFRAFLFSAPRIQ